jgi:hypothetical protein
MCVSHDHQTTLQQSEADHPAFAVVLALVLDLDGHSVKDQSRIFEVKPSGAESQLSLGRIIRDVRPIIVYTKSDVYKRSVVRVWLSSG